MGTRADFYVGRGEKAEWIGSIAWDGYPEGFKDKGMSVLNATSEANFRKAVKAFISGRRDGTTPDMGWPWPWDSSHTTDYSYAFDEGRTWGTNWGYGWWPANEKQPEEREENVKVSFPNMKDRANVTFGERSGVIILGG